MRDIDVITDQRLLRLEAARRIFQVEGRASLNGIRNCSVYRTQRDYAHILSMKHKCLCERAYTYAHNQTPTISQSINKLIFIGNQRECETVAVDREWTRAQNGQELEVNTRKYIRWLSFFLFGLSRRALLIHHTNHKWIRKIYIRIGDRSKAVQLLDFSYSFLHFNIKHKH